MKQFKEHVRNSVNTGSNDYSTNIKGGFFMKKTVSIILIGIILISMFGTNIVKVNAANSFPDYIYERSFGKASTNINVRAEPSINSKKIGLIATDSWVYIEGTVYYNNGYHWAFSSTANGYIAIDYLKNFYFASANKYDIALIYEVGDAYYFCGNDVGRQIPVRIMFKGDKIHALQAKSNKNISIAWGDVIWAKAGEWCQGVVYITPQKEEDFTFSIAMLDDSWSTMKEFPLEFKYSQLNDLTKIYTYKGNEYIVNKNFSEKYCYKQKPGQCPKYSEDIIISTARNYEYHDSGWISGHGATHRQSDGTSIIRKGATHCSAQEKRNLVGTLAANGIPSVVRLGGSSSSKGHSVACIGIAKSAMDHLDFVKDEEILIVDPSTAKVMLLSELKYSGYYYGGINGNETDNGWSIFIPAEFEWDGFTLI